MDADGVVRVDRAIYLGDKFAERRELVRITEIERERVLGDPPSGGQWQHVGIISHFVRGYWFTPPHPRTGPGLLEHLRLPLPLDAASTEECVETAARTIAEIE